AELLGYDRKGTAKVRVQYVGRAPLPGIPGTNVTEVASSQDSFIAPKPVTDESERKVAMASKAGAVTATELAAPTGVKSAPVSASPLPSSPVATGTPSSKATMRPIGEDTQVASSNPAPLPETVQHVAVPAGTNIFIQAGAFRSFANAEAVHQRLLAEGVRNVQVTPTMVDGNRYYRVRVGPLADVPSADAS